MLFRSSGWASQKAYMRILSPKWPIFALQFARVRTGRSWNTHQDRSHVEVPARGRRGSCDLEPGISDRILQENANLAVRS